MNDTVFRQIYNNLNKDQKRAVDTIDGPVMVIAGPGTGKTSILTLRIANILQRTDTTPDSILALTFTESGVHQMRKKLAEIIGTAAYRVHIFTFHGFCNEVIKKYPQSFPRIIGAEHVTDVEQIRIMEQILSRDQFSLLRPSGDPLFYVRPVLSEIRNLKREDIDPAQFLHTIAEQEKKFSEIEDLYHEKGKYKGKMKGDYVDLQKKIEKNKELQQVYVLYEEELARERLYDYEDMIMEVLRVLRTDEDLLLQLQEMYQYVLADEHQDANNAQNKLLELLSGFHENPNLFIVGDEKQAIFRFQGASLENFLYFKRRFPTATIISLSHNYRSSQHILDASFSLISKNTVEDESLRVELLSSRKGEFPLLTVHECATQQIEHEYVADHIARQIQTGTDPTSIAVLYRDNKDAAPLARALKRRGVPHTIYSDSDVFDDVDIQKFLSLIRCINDFGNDTLLAPVLFFDISHIDHVDVYRALRYAFKEKLSLYDVVRSVEHLTSAGVSEPTHFIALYEKLAALSVEARNSYLVDVVHAIERTFSFVLYLLTRPDAQQKIQTYDTLLGQISGLVERHKRYTLSDYIAFLDTLETHNITTKGKQFETQGSGVSLMTAHKSKGLEFDTVYCVGVYDGHWGNRSTRTYFHTNLFGIVPEDHDIEDERRLLYVAITRARVAVHLSYPKTGESGKELLPSQYLSEIDEQYIRKEDTSTFVTSFHEQRGMQVPTSPRALIDVSYISQLFLEQGLSVSALNNYVRCPWHFIFVNVLRIPEIQQRQQLYGTAIHETLKVFFDAYKKEEDMSKDSMLEFFATFLRRKPLHDTDTKLFLDKGREALSGYYDTYRGTWNRSILNEFVVHGVTLSLGEGVTPLLLKGNLDKVEIESDGRVVVVDYKTASPKSRNEIEGKTKYADGNFKRQLVFYKMLLNGFEDGKYQMRAGEIDFIEPDEKGRYKKERFEIEDGEVEVLEEYIRTMVRDIQAGAYWDQICTEKACQYCTLSQILKDSLR